MLQFNKPYEIGEVDRPSPGDDELLVRVHAAGFCHSDLQVLRGQFGSARLPMIPSHEPSGTVAAVGARCRGRWAVGDRVGVLNFKRSCRACPSRSRMN